MTVRISVDPNVCGCSGFCVKIAPDVFSLPEGGPARVTVASADLDPEAFETVREAEAVCPTGAIRILEAADLGA
jgi:ferredoxin